MVLITSLLFLSLNAVAGDAIMPSSESVYCAKLTKFEGDIQILNATKDQLIETKLDSQIPCGGWLSIGEGWLKIQHKDGYVLKTTEETLVEIFDNDRDVHYTNPEQVVLVRGNLFVRNKNPNHQIKIVTANGRVTMKDGQVVVKFNPETDETQVISLGKDVVFENRFANQQNVTVKRGEASTLDFKDNRVLPSTPKPVQIKSLKLALNKFPLSTVEYKYAMSAAQSKYRRKLPSSLRKFKGDRKIASQKKGYAHSYAPTAAEIKAYEGWKKRLLGGIDDIRLLYPDQTGNRQISSKGLNVIRNSRTAKRRIDKAKLLEEKKKILRELNKVQLME